jgi:hypothetical protein
MSMDAGTFRRVPPAAHAEGIAESQPASNGRSIAN